MKKANLAAVFGQGIIAQANDTFHVLCLNACDTPLLTLGLAAGTIAK